MQIIWREVGGEGCKRKVRNGIGCGVFYRGCEKKEEILHGGGLGKEKEGGDDDRVNG